MPSILPGYEYDLFISYRQKDNKGDRWVSEFVEALKTEIEATFKEDISIYFDENPHDRLQDTYNVDKSLEGKLKCLIFIPILSQTYCDPDCYAWKYEFQAFNKIAGDDPFGPHVRLKNGNVANRILPIRIHELDPDDVKLFEQETGTVLRAVDFVFKTASGVNRPLHAREDHPQDNLNRTFYLDQVNKLANAVKEIVTGLKTEKDKTHTGELNDGAQIVKRSEKREERKEREEKREESQEREERKEREKNSVSVIRRKWLNRAVPVGILVLIAAVLLYPKVFKRDTLDNLRSSDGKITVAVMPFQNLTNDTIWNPWQDGIQSILTNSLAASEELQVSQTELVDLLINSQNLTNYASITPSVAGTISKKLDAKVFIYGNIKQADTTLRIDVQLIDSKTKNVLKPFQIVGSSSEKNIFQLIDSLSSQVRDFLIISNLDKEQSPNFQVYQATKSPEAYRNFLLGFKAYRNRNWQDAKFWTSKALDIDSNFIFAMYMMSNTYVNLGIYKEAKYWCLRLYGKRDIMPIQLKITADQQHASLFESPEKVIKYVRQLVEINDKDPGNYYHLGYYLLQIDQNEKAITELEKNLEIRKKWDIKPWWINDYYFLGYAYHKTGQYKKEKKLYKIAERDFPDNPRLLYLQSVLSLTEGDTVAANRFIEKYKSVLKDNSSSAAVVSNSLGDIYSEADHMDKAEKYYRQAVELEPESPDWMNLLAWFLIDKNRNISQGLEIIERALKLRPENWAFLDTRGWGLCKLGKYEEALEILEKSDSLKPVYNHGLYLHLEEVKNAIRKKNIK